MKLVHLLYKLFPLKLNPWHIPDNQEAAEQSQTRQRKTSPTQHSSRPHLVTHKPQQPVPFSLKQKISNGQMVRLYLQTTVMCKLLDIPIVWQVEWGFLTLGTVQVAEVGRQHKGQSSVGTRRQVVLIHGSIPRSTWPSQQHQAISHFELAYSPVWPMLTSLACHQLFAMSALWICITFIIPWSQNFFLTIYIFCLFW